MKENFNTPILFLIFNRPETTAEAFKAICRIRPRQLFVAADGPRVNKKDDDENCRITRKIIEQVDWNCEVKTLFRDNNLGCKTAVSSAIDWFFENVEEGIILEDDCLPNESFFKFCQELLEKYRDNDKISIISGNHFGNKKIGDADYYFNRIPHIWGWATWRRAWKKYDIHMSKYLDFRGKGDIKNIWSNKKVQNYWISIFDDVYADKINSWGYRLTFSVFLNNNLCICPNVNLVSNIGFGKDFTNTIISYKGITNLSRKEIDFPLIHPGHIKYDEKNDFIINKFQSRNYRIKKILKHLGIFNFIKFFYIRLLKN